MKKIFKANVLSMMLSICLLAGSLTAGGPIKAEAAPVTRRMANVVVFVDFQDSKEVHATHAQGRCYEKEGSAQLTRDLFDGNDTKPRAMKQYLKNISYGQLEVQNIFPQMNGDQLAVFTLRNKIDYYLNSGKNMDSYIIQEVIAYLNEEKNLTQNPSLDGDDWIDNLMIVVPCEEGWNNSKISGHQAVYSGTNAPGVQQYNGGVSAGTYKVGSYIILPENTTYTSAHSDVIIHEFLHAVGYPDLYRQAVLTEGGNDPVRVWDIMGSVGRYPQYPLAYLRSSITKWFDIPTVATSQKGYSLYAASAAAESVKDRQAVILRTDYSNTEFFVIEYRKKGTDEKNSYDYFLPGSGLIIYRVDTRYFGNHHDAGDMIYVMRPGDEYDSRGREKGLNIYNAYLSETSYGSSDPGKSLKDNAIVYSDGTNSGIVISNIGKAGGDQITFDITFAEDMQDRYWKTLSTQDSTYEMDSYMDSDGTIYSLQRKSLGGSVYLNQYSASGWKQCSSVPIQNAGFEFKLGKYGGSFYVGYLDKSSRQLKLDQWTGSSWRNVYTSSDKSNYFGMSSSSDGIYLTYSDENGKNLYACRYSSRGMEALGSRVCQGSDISNPSIAAENGKIVVSYRGDWAEELYVKSYDSSSRTWKDVGNLPLKGALGKIRLHNNRIYLLKTGSYTVQASDLYMYDLSQANGSWKQIGNGPFANENAPSEYDLCFYKDDPHVIYYGASSGAVWVKNVVNGSWATLGGKVANETVGGLRAFSHGGNIYTTYYSTGSNVAYIREHVVNSTGNAPEGGGTTGGSTGGNTGGNTGGSSGGTTGGSTGGNTGGNTGGTTGGNTGGNTGSTTPPPVTPAPPVSPSQPSGPVDKSGIQNITVSMLKSNTLQLNWTPVSGALSYEVYYSTSKDYGYRRAANIKTSSYRFSKAKCGQTYYFQVRVVKKVGKKKTFGEFSLPVSGMTVLNGTPQVYVSRATYNSITVKWSKVKDAKKYEIYYSTSPNGGFRLLKTQGGTSFTHKGLQTGAVYYYQVRPMRDYYKGAYSNVTSARTVLGNVAGLKASPSGSDRMKVSWKKVKGVNYYVILRSDSPYGNYTQIGTTSRTSWLDTGLMPSTAYYYKVYAVAGPYQTNVAGPVGRVTKAPKNK